MAALTTKVLAVASCLVLAIGIYFYPRDDSFDHFYLSLQWPASVCNSTAPNKCFKPVPDYFTIHGLWAQTSNDKPYICDDTIIHKKICRNHPFNYDELKKDKMLMEMMNKRWPNLKIEGSSSPDQQNKKFWMYEWEKHGCCTFESKQNEYFKKTCGMWEKDPQLLQIFKKHGIIPGDQTYFLKQYIKAIQTELNAEPGTFLCNKNKNGIQQLQEVRLCADKEVTKFVDCTAPEPELISPSCGDVDDDIPIAFPIYNN